MASLTIEGISGRRYSFLVYPRGEKLPPVGAVYLVTKRDQKPTGNGGTHKVIYVGETGDVSARHDNHHRELCFNGSGANSIGILAEGNRDKRLKIEADIRQKWDPPCNQQ